MFTNACEQDARFLASHIVTNWDNYDFTERYDIIEKRVPTIEFKDIRDINVKDIEPEHVKGFRYEKFIRRYEVTYKDVHYLFVITVDSHFGCVRKFFITVYHVTKDEQKNLFTENL